MASIDKKSVLPIILRPIGESRIHQLLPMDLFHPCK